MSSEQQALLMVGDAGGVPAVQSCIGDPYFTCGPTNDPYWDKVVALLHFDGVNASTTFTESSTFSKTWTAQGAAQLGTANKKFGTASGLFNDGDAYIKSSSLTEFDFLTSANPFTVEAWIYPSSGVASVARHVFSISENNTGGFAYWYLGRSGTNNLIAYVQNSTGGGGTTLTATGALTLDTWQHIALSYDGTTARIFVNGNQVQSGSWNTYPTAKVLHVGIGGVANGYTDAGVGRWAGSIDELRVTRNVARYTGNFTIPVSAFPEAKQTTQVPLDYDPYWDKVKVLYKLNDGNGAATVTSSVRGVESLTAQGGATLSSAEAKFGASAYKGNAAANEGFTGYLSGLHQSNVSFATCCMECWVKNTPSAKQIIFGNYIDNFIGTWALWATTGGKVEFAVRGASTAYVALVTSTTSTNNSTYRHIAITRGGGETKLYVDGVLEATSSSSESVVGTNAAINFGIGRTSQGAWPYGGVVDEIRITTGEMRYYGNFTPPTAEFLTWEKRTVLSLHADDATDSSCSQTKAISILGSATVSGAQKKFGGSSFYVPNSGSSTANGISVTDHQDFDFGTSDFTIECWAYRIANTYVGTLFYGTLGGGEFSVKVGTDGLIDLVYRSSGGSQSFTDVATWPSAQWVHFITQRRGTYWETYLDGFPINFNPITSGMSAAVNNTTDFYIGRTSSGSAITWNGYIDDFRVTKGAARYTTPSIQPSDAHTVGSGDPYWNSTVILVPADSNFTDVSSYTRTPTLFGNAAISTSIKKFGAGSGAFDGTGDYVQYPHSTDFDFGSGDFTIECWFNPLSWPGANVNKGITCKGTLETNYSFVWYIPPSTNRLNFQLHDGTNPYSVGTGDILVLGVWHHAAIVRSGTRLIAFLNGQITQTSLIPANSSARTNTAAVDLGNLYGATYTNSFFHGYIDDFRITKGVARYTTNFTPPALTFCESQSDQYSGQVDGEEALVGLGMTSAIGTLAITNAWKALAAPVITAAQGTVTPVLPNRSVALSGTSVSALVNSIADVDISNSATVGLTGNEFATSIGSFGAIPPYPNFVNITQTNLYTTARPVYMRFEFNVDGTFEIVDQDSFVHYSGTWIVTTPYNIADIIANYQVASVSVFVGGSRVSWGNLPVPGPMPNGFAVTVQNVPQVSIVPFDFQVSITPTSTNPRYGEPGYAGTYRFTGQLEDLV